MHTIIKYTNFIISVITNDYDCPNAYSKYITSLPTNALVAQGSLRAAGTCIPQPDRNSLKIFDSHTSPLDEPAVCAYTRRTTEGLLLAWALCLRHQVVQDESRNLTNPRHEIISIFYQTVMVLEEITTT